MSKLNKREIELIVEGILKGYELAIEHYKKYGKFLIEKFDK